MDKNDFINKTIPNWTETLVFYYQFIYVLPIKYMLGLEKRNEYLSYIKHIGE